MKRMFSIFLLITVWLLVTPFLQAQSHVDKVLKDEITSDLKENILSFWERYSVDSSGGFYGSLGRDGAPIADAPKGGVLNARILGLFQPPTGCMAILPTVNWLTGCNGIS